MILFLSQSARAQDADAMSALVELLMESEDAAFQLDLLKGISAALKGQRDVCVCCTCEDQTMLFFTL